MRKLQRVIADERALQQYLDMLLRGLPDQLFNMPLDMTIEYHLHRERPYLYSSQMISIHHMMQEGVHGLEPNIQRSTPSRIWQASVALNCALAFFADFLYNGATDYADAYRKSGQYHNGEKLFHIWRRHIESEAPGSEYDLVDAFARELRLERWYIWREDRTAPEDLTPTVAADADAQAVFLKEREPAAVMYCLSALKKFNDMEPQAIRAVLAEIKQLHQHGLDIQASDLKYTLTSLPGNFTGLQLLCYLYVGLQMTDTNRDMGVNLDGAYAQAKRMYERGM